VKTEQDVFYRVFSHLSFPEGLPNLMILGDMKIGAGLCHGRRLEHQTYVQLDQHSCWKNEFSWIKILVGKISSVGSRASTFR